MQSKVVGLDVDQLKAEISKTYTAVSREPEREFIFPTGRAWAEDLDYPRGSARPPSRHGVRVVRRRREPVLTRPALARRARARSGIGCRDGRLVAAQMVGPRARVTGIDMTPAMLRGARRAAAELGADHVQLRRGRGRAAPVCRRGASTS